MVGLFHNFSLLRLVFNPRVVHMEYVLDKVASEQHFSEDLDFPLPYIIPPMPHTHLPYEGDTTDYQELTVQTHSVSTAK